MNRMKLNTVCSLALSLPHMTDNASYSQRTKKRGSLIRAGYAILMSMALLVGSSVYAWADDDLGDVDDPSSRSQAASVPASDTSEQASSEGVTISADMQAARSDAPFALDHFTRAQAGSNRAIQGEYYGYNYYEGTKPASVVMIATSDYTVIYVEHDAAESVGFDPTRSSDVDSLRTLLVGLDTANAHGGPLVSHGAWYTTTGKLFTIDGVTFQFNRELSEGAFYSSVTDEQGGSIVDAEDSHAIKLTHACFASLVKPEEATIVAQPTWFESAGTFLTTLDYSPLWVTLKTTGTAIVFIFILGLAAAYLCLHISPRARDICDAIFTIPMVLPPTVCGFLLLLLCGNNTAFGRWFISIGFPLIFSWQATVIAAVIVAFPLMYRSARGAFESLDANMLDAARTLGWSDIRIFFRLMLPLSWSNIAAGTVLAFARALGEFGATLFLAGNYLGITRTIPIAIYFEWMNGNTDVALFWTGVIMVFSFIVILFINLWGRHATRYRKESNA